MSFLTRIDELHSVNKTVYGIGLSDIDFSSFICIEPIDVPVTKKFIVRKQVKSKLLIVSGNQRVYLSDYHIISTILNMDKIYVDWFLNQFIEFYSNEYKPFYFKIDNDKFEGVGISCYPESSEILLFSDTKIDINDFIFVLNFVLFKDKQWEIDSGQENFSRKTLVKYISLIDYYSNQTERSMDYLSKSGYPIDMPLLEDDFAKRTSLLDINSFDISKYM